MIIVLKGLIVALILYVILAIINIIVFYLTKEYWSEEFKIRMKSNKYKIVLFLYGPVSVSKKIIGEICHQDTVN